MERALEASSQIRGEMTHGTLAKGIGWGLVGGLVATIVTDLVVMGTVSAAGMPADTCFSIVGSTVARLFSILGMDTAGGVPPGVAAHYIIGPLVGAIFGTAVVQVDALHAGTLKRTVVQSVVFIQVTSQPILATTPLLLKADAPDTLVWFGVSFVMHTLLGIVLGIVVYYGVRRSPAAPAGSAAPNQGMI